jgi:exodeoxyribonuclease III
MAGYSNATSRESTGSPYRGMKAYNGVATLSLETPEQVVYGLHVGPDNDDYCIIETGIQGIPIISTYVPHGYLITSEKYAFELAWFKRLKAFFEENLDPKKSAFSMVTSTWLLSP